MADAESSFWTPARIGAAIGVVLLVVGLAWLVSLPQNQFQPADLLQPRYAADADLGYWMVYEYDPEVDVYRLLVVMQHDNGTFEWLDGAEIWTKSQYYSGGASGIRGGPLPSGSRSSRSPSLREIGTRSRSPSPRERDQEACGFTGRSGFRSPQV